MRVIIESPYAGDVAANLIYARDCLLDSLRRGEAPFASHLLYPQVLNDHDPEERRQGIDGQLAWLQVADMVAVYVDRGISSGMKEAIAEAERLGIVVQERHLIGVTSGKARVR